MTEQQFVILLDGLVSQIEHDRKLCKTLETLFPDSTVMTYDNRKITDAVTKALELELGELSGLIDWYIWEYKFGGLKDAIIYINEKEHKVNTASDLFRVCQKIERNDKRKKRAKKSF